MMKWLLKLSTRVSRLLVRCCGCKQRFRWRDDVALLPLVLNGHLTALLHYHPHCAEMLLPPPDVIRRRAIAEDSGHWWVQ